MGITIETLENDHLKILIVLPLSQNITAYNDIFLFWNMQPADVPIHILCDSTQLQLNVF